MDPLEGGLVMNEQAILLRAMQTELAQNKFYQNKKVME